MKQLTENVYFFNCYPTVGMAVTPAGVIAIDGPMRPSDAVRWAEFIRSMGPLKYQVVTEHHQDHIASAHYLKPETIIASEITHMEFYKSIASPEEAKERILKYDPGAGPLLDGFSIRPPDITFKDRMTLRLGGRMFVLMVAPGHTRGETIVHAVQDRVCFASDNISPGASVAFHSADVWAWFQTLGLMEALDVDWYVPGHGDPCGRDEFPRQRQKMFDLIGMVKEKKDQGMSKEEVVKTVNFIDDYVDKKGLFRPKLLGPRAYMLMRGAVANIYDYLDEHPSGSVVPKVDPLWENV